MTLSSLCRGRRAANRARSATPARPFCPRLEALETREVPALLTPIQYSTGGSNGSLAYGVAVADFNGDGAADIAVVNYLGDNSVSILLNKGDGTFGKPQLISLGYDPVAIGVGDFNGDGRPDIVVAGYSSSGDMVSVLVNPASGGKWKVGQQLTQPVPAGMQSELLGSLAVGDFNGDGRPDVAVTGRAHPVGSGLSECQGYVHVLMSTAGGKAGTVQLSNLGSVAITPVLYDNDQLGSGNPTMTWTAVGDFYGNGHQEILSSVVGWTFAAGQPVNSTTALTAVTAAGTIAAPVPLGVGYGALAVGDFNHDGHLDFVSGGQIELGNGNGTFAAGQTLPSWCQSLAVGDFNHDGVPDLVVSDGVLGHQSIVYLGNGDGTFRQAGQGPMGTYGLAVGDFNRDGWADVVGVDFWPSSPSLWVGLNDKVWS
jgi:hypothetical protein